MIHLHGDGERESSDLITHTAAISDLRIGLGGVNKARRATKGRGKGWLVEIIKRVIIVEKKEQSIVTKKSRLRC